MYYFFSEGCNIHRYNRNLDLKHFDYSFYFDLNCYLIVDFLFLFVVFILFFLFLINSIFLFYNGIVFIRCHLF